MKNLIIIVLALICRTAFGQDKFSNCSAAFLNNKMIVEKYDAKSKASISKSAKGELTVCTANISANKTTAVDKILFSIAIKDNKTGTMVMESKKPIYKFDLAALLAKCAKGNSIVLLTENDKYALPHNEILVR